MQSIRLFFDAAGVAKHVARHDETWTILSLPDIYIDRDVNRASLNLEVMS